MKSPYAIGENAAANATTSAGGVVDAADTDPLKALLQPPRYQGTPCNDPAFSKWRAHCFLLHSMVHESRPAPILPCGYRFLGFRNREKVQKCLQEFGDQAGYLARQSKYSPLQAGWRLYLDNKGNTCVTQSSGDLYHLEKVWIPTPAAKPDEANTHTHGSCLERCNDSTCINYKPSVRLSRPCIEAQQKREDDPPIPKNPSKAVKSWDKTVGLACGGLTFTQPCMQSAGAELACVTCKDLSCPFCSVKYAGGPRKLTKSDLKYGQIRVMGGRK
ncbi:hypothetical protein Micbo1qcDRAFT_209122 [Microdochium bolleyi]|uniref:Uncharacterized protein n=1 Tax=Microdochium bolleyi TaxID=196109 RepID=A0A136IND0_9PEZI|nr:hypothetical protein Micbo1qcDRAFT_209122 [Microdochium bolleyi]